MKKLMLYMLVGACLMALPFGVQAYTINDTVPDAIGVRTFEGYGINVYNYTPGVNSGGIVIDLFTNYPQAGLTVGSWITKPADLFIKETYYGNSYLWAIPLVDHGDGFPVGTMYAVKSYNVSDFYEPVGGGYTYNHNVPVHIATQGSNYGWGSIGSFSVTWDTLVPPGSPDWRIHITSNIYQDDPNGVFSFTWGTATCANDVISGTVPEPGILILLGIAMSAIGAASWKISKL